MAKKILGLIAVFFGFLLSSQVVLGQLTTATISGTVKDTSEAVLPGVAVTIRNTQTGITRTITTDGQGRYTATNLAVGNYEVQSELQGFQTTVRSGIELTVGREAVVHFVLEVGAVAERIVVQAEAPLVDTTTSTVGGLVDTQQIADLPINARSYDKLARLEVGVTFTKKDAGSGGTGNAVGGRTEKMSIGGARVTQNLFLLDGTDISDKTGVSPGGVSGSALGMDAIREFRVLTSTYGAQYGRAIGGIVEVITKSGTNELHGSVFYYHRNDNLDARDFFDGDKKPEFKRNQFGGSAGGPVRKDKSFFFGSYEGLRERLGVTNIATVPNLGARSGNLGTSGTVTVAEAVKPYLALYPLPNGRIFGNGTGEFLSSVNQPTREDYFLVRGDHNFSPNHSLMGRYNFTNSEQSSPHNPPVSSSLGTMRRQTVSLESTQILSPTLLNKVRFGLNRSVAVDTNLPHDIPPSLDWVPGQGLLTSGQLVVRGIAALGGNRFVPNGYAWTSFQYGDDISYVRGAHSLKTGVAINRIRYNHKGADAISGEYQFNSLPLFLQKRPAGFLVQSTGTRNRWLRQTLFGTYVQDDIQLLSNLTLNLGVRWEFITSPVEIFGQSSNLVDIMDTELTVGNPFFETRKKNFSPRVGFAWAPTGSGTTSVRGGFGLFHDQPIPTYWYMTAQHNPPFVLRVDMRSNLNFPNDIAAARQVTATDLSQLELRSFVYHGTGYAMQYNLMLQKQLPGEMVALVGYMGSQARKLIRRSQANTKFGQLDATGEKFFTPTEPRRNPRLGNVEELENDVNANYNALVTSLRKRFAGGFQFQVSYTWSKALSIQDTIPGADLSGGRLLLADSYDPGRDYGPAEHDVKHTFVGNYTYDLPFGQNLTGAARVLLGGWQLGGIVTIASGSPYAADSFFLAGDGTTTFRFENRADVIPGGKNNPILGGADHYFDVSQFVPSRPGYFGNVGRNTMYDPGMIMADLSLLKKTNLGESLDLQFRAEFFNILNRTNLGVPQDVLFDGSGRRNEDAGRIRNTATTSRQVQFSLRLVF